MSLTVLMPFVGYFILFNQQLSQFLDVASSFLYLSNASADGSGQTYRLYFLYYGLNCLGIAQIIYSLSCPAIIKEYMHADDFAERKLHSLTRQEFQEIAGRTASYGWLDGIAWEDIVSTSVNDWHWGEWRKAFRERLTNIFTLYHRKLDALYVYRRAIVALLYVCGFTLLAVPSLQVFVLVSKKIML